MRGEACVPDTTMTEHSFGRELRSHLWNCAEILRGSAVDRTDWKAYILPLLFFKRICDVWDEETAEAARALRRRRPGRLPRGPPLRRPRGLPLARRPRDPGQRRRCALPRHARDRARQPRHPLPRLRRRRLGQPRDAHRRDPQGPDRGAFGGLARQQGRQHGRPRRRLRVPDRQVRRRHQAQEGRRVLHPAQRRPDDGRHPRPEGGREHLRPGLRHGRHAARRDRARAARGRRRRARSSARSTARRRTSPPRPSRA